MSMPHLLDSIDTDRIHLSVNAEELEPVLNVEMSWSNRSIADRAVRPAITLTHANIMT